MDRMPKAVSVDVPRPYVIRVGFSDGTSRDVAMESELWGAVFEPLRDPELFAQATLEPTCGSVSWPTGADLAPEFLYYGDENPYASLLEEWTSDNLPVASGRHVS